MLICFLLWDGDGMMDRSSDGNWMSDGGWNWNISC